MNDSWFYHEDGATYGPMPESDIRALTDAGAIDHAVLVRRESDEDWIPLADSVLVDPATQSSSPSNEGVNLPPPPKQRGPSYGASGQSSPVGKRSVKSVVIGLVIVSLGVAWYFFSDEIKLAFHQIASSDRRNIDAVLDLSAKMRAAHLQAAIQFPGQPEAQASFLTGELRAMDVSACPANLQVEFRDYINAWDPHMVPDPDHEDFRPLLFLLGRGQSAFPLPEGSDDIINAYNALAEAAKAEGVYIQPAS